jgi:tetratricopeptide (TPR) repeat protein
LRSISKYTIPALVLLLVFSACKTNKNTVVHRGYHNLTARFNGYYYATESIKEAENKIRADYKLDYDRLLPVFLVPTEETAKATFPDFDKAIKKSSNCIQRHTIKDKKGNEIASAGHWIDNNWNVIGISHFYKREFFSAIEAFEYVIRTYKSPDRYKAMVWLARSYNEIGSVTQAEPIIGLLKDDKKISAYAKQELPALQADYYLRRGMYKEAEKALLEAIKAKPPKKTRARYAYILGQIYDEKNDNKKARDYYQKTISAKPDYDLVFHAKMRQARLVDLKYGNTAKLKRDLLKMTRDEKNSEYLDMIYYTLGEISEREKNEPIAIANYKLSIANSTQNPKQKALSYLKLGEINFEQANYEASGAYYDSTMITLPKDYKDYATIDARKKTLETLVGYIRAIQREDSLQRVAKMTESQREKFITRMIQKIEEDEERKREEMEALQAQNANPSYTGNAPNNGMTDLGIGAKGDWYFYNPTLVAFGLNDFIKKWGNRKLEDNWRRSQKSMTFDEPTAVDKDSSDVAAGTDSIAMKKKAKAKDKKSVEYYLKDLPLTDSLMKLSNAKAIDAYYNLGSTYKDDLRNNKKAIATFEEMNKRYDQHKFRPSTYYQLYRIFQSVKNNAQADFYKNKLLNEFPNSEYAQLIKNPNYEAEKKLQKGEVELFYTQTFDKYVAGNYDQAYALSKESESKFGKTEYSPKFAFIKAMTYGKMKGADSLEMALRTMQALYPKDPVSKEAQELLEVLYNLKHPDESTGTTNKTDTFTLNLKAKHFVIAVFPDDPEMANTFKSSLADFNTQFYGISSLAVESSLFGGTEQIVYVKTFENSETAMKYISNLNKDKAVFSGKVKPELFTIMAISEDNIQRLARKKKISYYKPFYEDHYR